MLMRRRLGGALGGIALASLIASLASAQPNIVLILSDDHNWRDYSFSGENPYVRTPHIDELASEGVLIQRAYAPTSVCRPSLMTIFTGLHSVTSGITGNQPAPTGSRASDRRAQAILRRNLEYHATLPRLLHDRGYRSLQTGKWWEGDYRRSGFDAGDARDRNRVLTTHRSRSIGRGGIEPIEKFVLQAVEDAVPFFVSYAPLLPHVPHSPPRSFRDVYDPIVERGELTRNQAKYYATVDWFDTTVGELRSFLRATDGADGRPLDDNTLYVYAVDNGWAPELTGYQTSLGTPTAKRSPFDDGIRGPLILFWKGEVADARTIEQKLGDTRLASTIDILPTLLSLIGASEDRPALAQGIDLLNESRNEIFGDTYDIDIPVTTGDQLTFDRPEASRTSRWLIDGRWKLIAPDGEFYGGVPQLYDLIADPGEATDLAAEQPDRTAKMTARLDDWWTASRPNLLYAHEFAGTATSIDGHPPDLDRTGTSVFWRGGVGVQGDGALTDGGVGGAAVLPFEPEDGKRYELRVAGNGLELGFLARPLSDLQDPPDSGVRSTRLASYAVAWASVLSDNGPGIVLHVRGEGTSVADSRIELDRGGERAAVTLVLDTGDHDEGLEGDQWSLELLVGGISRLVHVYRHDNPDIDGVGLGGAGDAGGRIDYFQLVETPRFESLAWSRGDTNGDGKVDRSDLRVVWRNYTGSQTSPPSFAKTLREGDGDGDGDVDWSDAAHAAWALLTD